MAGGITFCNSSSIIDNSIIGENSAEYGGGIFCYGSPSLRITDCNVSNNSADFGAGLFSYYSSSTIENCLINENIAANSGGGIYCIDDPFKIINCIIIKNSAVSGGGIYCTDSSPTITNCTISENSVIQGNGGGIYCTTSSPIITNCILWKDSPEDLYISSGNPSVNYSDIQISYGFYSGNGNINNDPLFVDPNGNDYRLQDSSLCIDAGTNEGAPSTDKDGTPRPRGIYFDMGAYESITSAFVYPGNSLQEAIDNLDDGAVITVFPGVYSGGINFSGKAITVRSTNPDDPNVVRNTIIDGNNDPNVGSLVTFNSGETQDSELNGLTLRKGIDTSGGGIFIDHASPTIRNCNIEQNTSPFGGGIHIYYASPAIQNCNIEQNFGACGGGIYCFGLVGSAVPTFTNCNISENSSVAYGGGVYTVFASPQFFNCNISENYVEYHGGGIFISEESFPYFENCTINKNFAASGDGNGEAVFVGGDSGHDFIFCTIAENGDGTGSAIYYNDNDSDDLGTFKGGIIWNNNSQYEISGYPSQHTTPIVIYSDIRGGYDGEGNINSVPLFVDPNADDYHLQDLSPCIDIGTNDGAPSTDKDGNPRPSGLKCDIGAYENTTSAHVYQGYSIQQAIDAASEGQKIFIYPGTYTENIDFSGKAITIRSVNPDDPNVVANTVIDGDLAGSVFTFENGEGEDTILDGLTIQNGSADYGGGIHCVATSPTITNCVITGNTASDYGGGIYCYDHASPIIINCRITGNLVEYTGGGDCCSHGGGIFTWGYCSPTITNCTIMENWAAMGGGMYFYSYSSSTITDSIISKNTSIGVGGGISCQFFVSPTIMNCTIKRC